MFVALEIDNSGIQLSIWQGVAFIDQEIGCNKVYHACFNPIPDSIFLLEHLEREVVVIKCEIASREIIIELDYRYDHLFHHSAFDFCWHKLR